MAIALLVGCTSVNIGTDEHPVRRRASDITSPATLNDFGMLDKNVSTALDATNGVVALETAYFSETGTTDGDEQKRRSYREQVVRLELEVADGLYYKWSNGLFARAGFTTTTLDIAAPALSSAAGIVTNTAAKVLSALSTTASASNAAIQKDIFQQQAINALFAASDANRATIRNTILLGLQTPTSKYSLTQAETDVGDYIRAGTLLGSLEVIQQTSGNAKTAVQDKATKKIQDDLSKTAENPSITTQPDNQAVKAGTTATFKVVAAGTPTPTYQWFFNTTAISGASSDTYQIANVATANVGDYWVLVTNSKGQKASDTVKLTITP